MHVSIFLHISDTLNGGEALNLLLGADRDSLQVTWNGGVVEVYGNLRTVRRVIDRWKAAPEWVCGEVDAIDCRDEVAEWLGA